MNGGKKGYRIQGGNQRTKRKEGAGQKKEKRVRRRTEKRK